MITTVIPTHRRPRFLARAVRSVLGQTYPQFQVVVYDNASGDDTAAVVEKLAAHDSRVRYHGHLTNLGALQNFNFGLAHVDTEFFSILSDDDILFPHFYEHAMRAFASHPRALFVASPVALVDEHGRVLLVTGNDWEPGLYPPPSAALQMAAGEHFIWTGTVFRREVLELGLLDPETGLSSDMDLLLRITARHPIVVAPRTGAIFSVHRDSPSSHPRLEQYWPSWSRIIAKVAADTELASGVRDGLRRGLERRLRRALFRIGVLSLSRGYDGEAEDAAAALRARYGSFVEAALLRLGVGCCRHLPGARWALRGLIDRLRWRRRGQFEQEQALVDQHAELLRLPGPQTGPVAGGQAA